jgi:hypothetical protein
MSKTNRSRRVLFSVLIAALLIGVPGISAAQSLKNQQNEIGNLGGAWWEWAFNTVFAGFGDGDVDCSVGQKGGVWNLAGTFGGPGERSCTIPKGKRLFIPLANSAFFYEAGVDNELWNLTTEERRIYLDGRFGGGSLAEPQAVADLAACSDDCAKGVDISTVACDLHATLDGDPLVFKTAIVRAQSDFATISTEALCEAFGCEPGPPDEEAIADGFWARIEPLAAGEHTLQFGGAFCDAENLETRTFATTVIYNLTVEGDDDD